MRVFTFFSVVSHELRTPLASVIGYIETLQAAKAAGCTRIVAVDVEDTRLARARTIGATDVFNPTTCDVPQAVRDLTGGRGADVIYHEVPDVHVSGHASADELRLMMNLTRPRYFIPMHGTLRLRPGGAKE